MLDINAIQGSEHYEETLKADSVKHLVAKYMFKGLQSTTTR